MNAFEVLEFAFEISSLPLSVALSMGLQRALLRRMSPERQARVWPPGEQLERAYLATNFPLGAILSMIPFCVVTRTHRGPKPMALAILKGLLASVVLTSVLLLYGVLYGSLLEFLDPRLLPALMGT